MTAIGARNLARLAEQALDRLGDRDSLFFEGRWHRSSELHQRSARLAGGLVELGIRPGDRVVVFMSNSADVGPCYSALWRAGAAITPAIFLLSEAELRHLVADSGARAVLTTPDFLDRVLAACRGLPELCWVVCAGPHSQQPGLPTLVDLESLGAGPEIPIVGRDDGDLAALMYTGGTTGRAKGVMLSHENLWWAGRMSVDAGRVPGINRSLIPLPLSHSFGLLVTVVGLQSEEPGSAVLMRWFDSPGFLELAQEHRVQQAPLVPSMLQALLAQPLEDYDLSELRFFTCGAAPLSPEVIEEVERRFPNVEIREGYGLTESGAIVSTNPPGRRRVGSVGLPVPGCEVSILGEDGRPVDPGDPGEIWVRSPSVMRGYWRAPGLTAETVVEGRLRTGDVGRVDEDGYLFILDRKKDLIIRGGFNVFPRDVEDALLEHPAVSAAAVVGRPDARLGEEVVAFVALRPGAQATEDELVEFGRGRLGGYKYPREVHVVDKVPLTPVGKVDRKAVRDLL